MAGIFGESESEKLLKQFASMYGDVLSGKTPFYELPEFKYGSKEIQNAMDVAMKQYYRTAGEKGLTGGVVNKGISDIIGKAFEAKGGMAGNIMQNLWSRVSGTSEFLSKQEMEAMKTAIAAREAREQRHLQAQMAQQQGSKSALGGSAIEGGASSCCFIFIEGERLTDNVKTLRDEMFHKGGIVENGYRRMARWLVPMMGRNWFVKKIVGIIMLNPICDIADHYYGDNSYGWIFRPIGHFWKKLWERMGK